MDMDGASKLSKTCTSVIESSSWRPENPRGYSQRNLFIIVELSKNFIERIVYSALRHLLGREAIISHEHMEQR
jgi:hypothetical protein